MVSKVFRMYGSIFIPMNTTQDEVWKKFMDFIKANGWSFAGDATVKIDGAPIRN